MPISVVAEWAKGYASNAKAASTPSVADALAVATYLNVFLRHCQTVRLANLAQLVNAIAPIFTSPEGLFLQTTYHPLRLYAEHMQSVALDAYVDCETYALDPAAETSSWPHRLADLGPFQLLDVAATRADDGHEVVLGVVNRDGERPLPATIELPDGAVVAEIKAFEVNGEAPGVVNSFERPEAVAVREHAVSPTGRPLQYTFPAHSVTLLRLRLAP